MISTLDSIKQISSILVNRSIVHIFLKDYFRD